MMLYIKLIIKLDKTDKYKPTLIVKDIMNDINRPVCVQVCILITFEKLQRWYEVRSRGSKQETVFLLYVCMYTKGCHKLHKRPRRFPLFSL